MIRKYRKKPIEVEAIQFLDNVKEIENWVGFELSGNMNGTGKVEEIIIPTPEGEMWASQGDYIIKGIKGEFYPCKPDIFEATYEEVK
jgi:hypothetical protein